MTEAEKLFNETFGRWFYTQSVVSNFRSTFKAVASSASEHLHARMTDLTKSLFEDPMWKGILVDIETGKAARAKSAAHYARLSKVAATELFETSYASLDAAVLVFYHSLLDGLVFDCCRVTALHAPRDWEQDLNGIWLWNIEVPKCLRV